VLDEISLLPRLDLNTATGGLHHDFWPQDASDFFVKECFYAYGARQIQRDGTVGRQDRTVTGDGLFELASLRPR
jgi:hypothetical protein